MNKHLITAEKREVSGRKVKSLRRKGVVPANVYGRDIKSVSIQVGLKDFEKVYEAAGETGLLELTIGNEKRPVLIHNVQKNPIDDSLLHIDFLQVNLKQKVTAEVPLELVGESPVEKQGLGTVVQYINKLEVEALPTDLPDKFEIDLSVLTEVEQVVQVKDIKTDKEKVEISSSGDEIVVKVEPPKEEKEELPAPAEEVAAEGEGQVEGENEEKTQESASDESVKE